ncbi:hypothetical protein M8C21_006870 [Ambrosia artemisiifolia]|uniref:Uncharacterized protein n=1 Tax=Ambrosia artemisiifolia TaxID=4212 RepID=A0AAD5CI53_AMBAR|nr:hypothetical protein M8C21_006870 [Ambrosia artemisiifolia]
MVRTAVVLASISAVTFMAVVTVGGFDFETLGAGRDRGAVVLGFIGSLFQALLATTSSHRISLLRMKHNA